MQETKDQARAEFISEGNQLLSQLVIEIEKRKPSYLSKAFHRLRLIVTSNKKKD
mgnify:CR=1 FL=1|jgi:hypothetical protein|tara:strand:- start:290 stop:451 length:162 start_codon:yes stop_codon:yes gene_type:complete